MPELELNHVSKRDPVYFCLHPVNIFRIERKHTAGIRFRITVLATMQFGKHSNPKSLLSMLWFLATPFYKEAPTHAL